MTDIISLMFASALFYTLQLSVPVGGIMSQKLHNHMTKREIRHYFGVDNHDKVPEYDISHPYQSNEQGEFVTYSMYSHTRNKRDIEPQASPFYIMDAFGTKLHLKLKRNDHLLAPGMTVLRRNNDGTTTIHPAPANTFYLGQVASDPKSMIAVSNHGGLTGMVKTSRNTLFVHPLPAHLAKHVTSKRDATPHLVYQRTLKQSDVGYEMLEGGKGTDLGKTVDTKHLGSNSQNDESDRSKYRTLKVGYLYPRHLAHKYSQGYMSVLGGVENYLALLANIVAGFFQDHTVGKTKITYVLTNISMINPQEYGFKESDYIGHKLNKITAKLKQQNVPYDVFSYVSNQNAQRGAVANLYGMCKGIIGNVNNDIGLQTTLHIAHETAHNLHVGHDSGECAKGYIMSAGLPNGVHATEWSPCSRNALQAFLADRKKSKCLDDGITENDTVLDSNFRNTLPGLMIDGDKQCESLYAAGFKRIDKHQCAVLRCEKHGVILTDLVVVMDGTSCIPGMWCIKGLCQSSGLVWTMNKDYWSDWGHDYSQCTRSCGGGVQFVTRRCTHPKPGSKYCQGQRRKYRICNPLACPANGWRFRDQQCADRIPNARAYLARHLVGCGRLFCRIRNVVQSKGSVLDGTRCTVKKDDPSVCLHGRCRIVGCDNVFDSTVKFDRCGVCGGNGSTCKIEFKYAGVPDAYGPESATLIAELLPGTREASFYMARNTKNYIGVQNATGNYLVGGHLGGYQSINAAGTVIELHHEQTGMIIGNGKNGGVNGAFGHQIRFKEKQPDAKMIMDKPGVYFLVLSNCGNFDTATVSGEVIVKNSHGYLPANEYGKMPFYAIMTACTVVVFLLWALLCVRWWKVLFNIHLIIGALALLSILESIGWFIHLFTWNESGVDNKAIFFIAIFLSVSRSTLSYMLVLSACLGWGVTKPVLDGGTICRMVSLSLVYIALNVVREVVLADRHQQTVPVAFVILCLLPVSLMNGGIFYWIFAALSNLMETLEAQGQTAKLSLFQQLWWVLVSGIVFAFAVLLAQIFIVANDTSSWQYQWLVQDCAPQTGFLIVLIAVMYLWCPNEDTQRFAYSAQLEGELDNLDEHIEKAEVLSADEKEVDVIGARS